MAKFVDRQMSGITKSLSDRMMEQLDIHLCALKDDVETSLIPLGRLRVGSYLERALLFKVLADRICLPTALVRGEYGKAWVEISIPEVRFHTVHSIETKYNLNNITKMRP